MDFFSIFEELGFEERRTALEPARNKWLIPFNEDWYRYSYPQMIAIYIKPSDLVFTYYQGCEGNNAWGNCGSLHAERPFYGITLFDDRTVFKRNLDVKNNEEVIQVESLYCPVKRVYKVKENSPLRFRSETDFQNFVKQLDQYEKLNCYDFVVPNLEEAWIDENGNAIPTRDEDGYYIPLHDDSH